MNRSNEPSSDARLLAAASRNPSRAGRELLIEILARGPEPEETERPLATDMRAALTSRALDDPDYRTAAEQADWLGRESQQMRDLYERGAVIKGETLIIPAEGHELREDAEQPFITTIAYSQQLIRAPEKAAEFHALGRAIAGEMTDARGEIETFRFYHDRLGRDERGRRLGREQTAQREAAVERTLHEMRAVATAMRELETQHSLEVLRSVVSLDQPRDVEREDEFQGLDGATIDHQARISSHGQTHLIDEREGESFFNGMNVSARKVRLREEHLRLPAGLSYEAKERLVVHTLPAIDRKLESGTSRQLIFAAVDGHQRKLDETQHTDRRPSAEWLKISVFIKAYTDERLNDSETRALNRSIEFRAAHNRLNAARTPKELSLFAEGFLRENAALSRASQKHQADPEHNPPPVKTPLDARARHLLFFGRSPTHFTPEMRQLKYDWGLSREERAARTFLLREKQLEPSPPLKAMLHELESRSSVKAVAHYQASILNERVENPGRLNLRSLRESLVPHERDYLFERIQSRKLALARVSAPAHTNEEQPKVRSQQASAGRTFGQIPVTSGTYRNYMASMGAIEYQFLGEAVRRRHEIASRGGKTGAVLSITEARALLPQQERTELRLRARKLAWEAVIPLEVFARNPSSTAMRLSDAVAHTQEQLQEKARVAHAAREQFIQEQVTPAEKRLREDQARNAYQNAFMNKVQEWKREAAERGDSTNIVVATKAKEAHWSATKAATESRSRPLFASPEEQEQFTRRVLAQLAPTEARKLAELDHYAARTREEVYRSFETIDALQHELETARAQTRTLREGREAESPTEMRWMYVASNKEWHFESLRQVLGAGHHRESERRVELDHDHSEVEHER